MANENKRLFSNALPSFLRLPVELQTEIFSRLPLTSLPRCIRVCKSFRTLIRSPDFVQNHVSTSHSLLLQFKHEHSPKIGHTSHVLVSIDNTTKDVISYTSLVPQIQHVGMLFLIGSCNGLVCFAVRTDENKSCDDMLLLWNPVTEQNKYIPLPNIDGYSYQQAMEFYFVPETNDYNILSLGFNENLPGDIDVAVYRVRTNSWEIVHGITLGNRFDYFEYYGKHRRREWGTSVFLNGSFHWIFSSSDFTDIVSFNVKDEKLGRIRHFIGHDLSISWGIYDIGIIDQSLALFYWSNFRQDIEIQVMNDYGVQDSWVLKYTLSLNNNGLQGCWNNSVMTSDGHSLYCYDTNDVKMMKKLISLPENSFLLGFSSFSLPWLH